ncbi:MAG: hypothetical protein ACT4PP_05695 [Sporichthyaceae bacterium]
MLGAGPRAEDLSPVGAEQAGSQRRVGELVLGGLPESGQLAAAGNPGGYPSSSHSWDRVVRATRSALTDFPRALGAVHGDGRQVPRAFESWASMTRGKYFCVLLQFRSYQCDNFA